MRIAFRFLVRTRRKDYARSGGRLREKWKKITREVEGDYARRESLLGVEALPFGCEEKGQLMWAADMRGGDE